MQNRLLMIIQRFAVCAFVVICACPKIAHSQFNQFIFSYPGPDTIAVGTDCMASLSPLMGTPNVASNVQGVTITESHFGSSMPAGTVNTNYTAGNQVTVYWYVKNSAGVDATFQFTITFVDKTPPTIVHSAFPDDITVASIATAPPPPVVTAVDNCTLGGNLVYNYSETAHPALCEAGSFDRVYTYTDAAGNTSTWAQTVHVQADNAPPSATYTPTNSSNNCSEDDSTYTNWVADQQALFTAGVFDVSGFTVTTNAPVSLPPGCDVVVTVNFKAMDNCGHEVSKNANFHAEDVERPTVGLLPNDTLVYCANNNYIDILAHWITTHGGATANDNCANPDSLEWIMEVFGGAIDSSELQALIQEDVANDCGYRNFQGNALSHIKGLAHVTFHVKDACNTKKFVSEVDFAVRDTMAPIVTGTPTLENCGGGDDPAKIGRLDKQLW